MAAVGVSCIDDAVDAERIVFDGDGLPTRYQVVRAIMDATGCDVTEAQAAITFVQLLVSRASSLASATVYLNKAELSSEPYRIMSEFMPHGVVPRQGTVGWMLCRFALGIGRTHLELVHNDTHPETGAQQCNVTIRMRHIGTSG